MLRAAPKKQGAPELCVQAAALGSADRHEQRWASPQASLLGTKEAVSQKVLTGAQLVDWLHFNLGCSLLCSLGLGRPEHWCP